MFVCRRPGPRRALRPTGGGVRTGGRAGRRVAQRGRRPTKPPPAMAARSSGRRPSAGRRLPARLAPGAKGRATSRCDAPAAYAARAARSSARAHGISPAWLLEQHTQQQQHLHLVVGDGRANISTCIRMGGSCGLCFKSPHGLVMKQVGFRTEVVGALCNDLVGFTSWPCLGIARPPWRIAFEHTQKHESCQ